MILITGGKYQGKLDFALGTIGVTEENVSYDLPAEGDKKVKIINNCEAIIKDMIKINIPVEDIREIWKAPDLKDKILIFNDVTMGIVPIDADERRYREAVGKVATELAESADIVYRVFCGIPLKLK